jgi:hypothetical protein
MVQSDFPVFMIGTRLNTNLQGEIYSADKLSSDGGVQISSAWRINSKVLNFKKNEV